MSHLGFGAEFGNFVMLALLALVAVFAIRFVMRRFAPAQSGAPRGMQFAGAGASPTMPATRLRLRSRPQPRRRRCSTSRRPSRTVASRLPADFDAPGSSASPS